MIENGKNKQTNYTQIWSQKSTNSKYEPVWQKILSSSVEVPL